MYIPAATALMSALIRAILESILEVNADRYQLHGKECVLRTEKKDCSE